MSSVICFASKCKWNDSERDEEGAGYEQVEVHR